MKRKTNELLEFLEPFVVMKEMLGEDGELMIDHKNVIDMDIINLKGKINKQYLDMEIVHYMKDRSISQGMSVKFKLDAVVDSGFTSKVRNVIFRKDVMNVANSDNMFVTLHIDTIEEFVDFFQKTILGMQGDLKSGVL